MLSSKTQHQVSILCSFHPKKMMRSEIFQPSLPFYDDMNSSLDQVGYHGLDMEDQIDACEFYSSFTTPEEISDSCSIPFSSTMFLTEFAQSPSCDGDLQVKLPLEDYLLDMEGIEPNFSDSMECVYGSYFSESEGNVPSQEMYKDREDVWSPSPSIESNETSMDTVPIQPSTLTLPGEDLELDNQLSIYHLFKAYGEAIEGGHGELADVIMRRVSEKACPAGETLERLAFNLSRTLEKQGDYLRQESCKNFEAAFRAFYQIFPYGRFAHFAANSAILEAMPADAETLHIVDFDIGEGIQWPPMIEALAQVHKTVRLTAIKWEKEGCDWSPFTWSFEEAKTRLIDHARRFGLMLTVEEMKIEELVGEIRRTRKRGDRKVLLAFNCMVGLPHMGRLRSRKLVKEFLRVARDLTANSVSYNTCSRGVITLADGDNCENLTACPGFGSFFNGNLMYYRALLESIESNFPTSLAEARMALECLFVAPYISSHSWFQRWMEIKEDCNLQVGTGLEGCRVSKESLEEAREMVKDNQSLYGVRIGGHKDDEMILEWKGTPLVRVSALRN